MYKKMSDEDKLSLLLYERGASALVRVRAEDYESLSKNPTPSPRPSDVYLSHVLGIDYRKFYNSELAKRSWDLKEFMEDIAMPLQPSGYKSVFIGDMLNDILYMYTHPDADHDLKEIIPELDEKLQTTYNKFMKLAKLAGKKHKYEKATVVDGEQLYRRVK